MQFNVSNISTPECARPRAQQCPSTQTKRIASVASTLDVAVPETCTLRSRDDGELGTHPLELGL